MKLFLVFLPTIVVVLIGIGALFFGGSALQDGQLWGVWVALAGCVIVGFAISRLVEDV